MTCSCSFPSDVFDLGRSILCNSLGNVVFRFSWQYRNGFSLLPLKYLSVLISNEVRPFLWGPLVLTFGLHHVPFILSTCYSFLSDSDRKGMEIIIFFIEFYPFSLEFMIVASFHRSAPVLFLCFFFVFSFCVLCVHSDSILVFSFHSWTIPIFFSAPFSSGLFFGESMLIFCASFVGGSHWIDSFSFISFSLTVSTYHSFFIRFLLGFRGLYWIWMGFTGGSCLFSFTKLFFSIIVSFSQPLSKLFLFSTDCFSFVTVFFFFFVSTRFPVPATTSTSRYYVFFYNFSLFYHYFFLPCRASAGGVVSRAFSLGRTAPFHATPVRGGKCERACVHHGRTIHKIHRAIHSADPRLASAPPPFFTGF